MSPDATPSGNTASSDSTVPPRTTPPLAAFLRAITAIGRLRHDEEDDRPGVRGRHLDSGRARPQIV